jgi:hypothetical protein
VWQETTQEDTARSDMFTLQDEFTDNSLGLSSQDSGKVYKLPKGTYEALRSRVFYPVCGSRFIESGSGSDISNETGYGSGSKVLTTNCRKDTKFIFF